MKQTLLEMTQEILGSMESDEVDSISDTGEATLVARIIRRAYWDMVGPLDAPEHYKLFELEASGSSTYPTLMYLPSDILSLEWVKYNKETLTSTDANFQEVIFRPLDQYLKQTLQLKESDTDVDTFDLTVGTGSITFLYNNNAGPRYFTTPDDYTLVFDSYDSDVDSTLQKTKTLCYGLADTTFTMSDNFTPDLDARQFPLLLNEAKSLAFAELKQTQHARAERSARRQWVSAQKTKRAVMKKNPLDSTPNYGWR